MQTEISGLFSSQDIVSGKAYLNISLFFNTLSILNEIQFSSNALAYRQKSQTWISKDICISINSNT